MKTMMKTLLASTIAAAAFVSAPASAARYMISYTTNLDTNAGTTMFAGTVTTADTANANGFYLITNLTGLIGGRTATLLPTGSIGDNDNLFKPTANYVNLNGFSFTTGSQDYNVFYGTLLRDFGRGNISNFTVTNIAAVPEPATWLTMLLGFGMMGATMRYRRRSTKVAIA